MERTDLIERINDEIQELDVRFLKGIYAQVHYLSQKTASKRVYTVNNITYGLFGNEEPLSRRPPRCN